MAVVRVPALPETLQWAREALGASIEEVAKAAGVHAHIVRAWENGSASPTMKQLAKVASKLDRTMASFFLPPPERSGVPEVADFRGRLRGQGRSSIVSRHLKHAEAQRSFFLDLADPDAPSPKLQPFSWDTVDERATQIRNLLLGGRTKSPTDLKGWIGALERVGILVFQASSVPLDEFRGVSIYHARFPIVVLNGADSEKGRIFSLFHEIAHLCNRSSAMCMNLENDAEEVLCNRFSAELLAPRRAVYELLRSKPRNPVNAVAATFGISSLAAAVRLHSLDLLDDDELGSIREESDRAWEAKRQRDKDKDGFVPHWRLRYRDLGPTYVATVIGALEDSRIDYLDASYMLNARIPTIERMQQELHTQGVL